MNYWGTLMQLSKCQKALIVRSGRESFHKQATENQYHVLHLSYLLTCLYILYFVGLTLHATSALQLTPMGELHPTLGKLGKSQHTKQVCTSTIHPCAFLPAKSGWMHWY